MRMIIKVVFFVGAAALVLSIFWRIKGKEACASVDTIWTVTTNVVTPSFTLFSFVDDEPMMMYELEITGLENRILFEQLKDNPFCKFRCESNNDYSCIVDEATFYLGKVIAKESDANYRNVFLLKPESQDRIVLKESHSAFSWKPRHFDLFSRVTRHRFAYVTLKWEKASGQTLVIKWKYLHHYNLNMVGVRTSISPT
jgi:hypothetical protein